MALQLPAYLRKVLFVLLIVAVAALPVFFYDRLVVKELMRRPTMSLPDAVLAYHEAFYTSAENWNMTWLGIPTIQNPNDIWVTQELISRLKPDFIVEAGTWRGGGAVLWAMVQDQVNPRGRVITIDIADLVDHESLPPIGRQKVDFLIGSSTDPRIVADVKRRVGNGKVMVVLDSDHRKAHVLDELHAYGSLVTVGSYLIVQDTNLNGHPVNPGFGPGPMEAVLEFLAGDDRYRSDRRQERLLFSMHPRGYLLRVK